MHQGIDKPENCLLGLAPPGSQADFFRDLLPDTDKDFAKSLKRRQKYLKDDRSLWENIYSPTASLMLKVGQEAACRGVKVLTNLTLEDLRACCASGNYKVITLVTHWQGSTVKENDFTDITAVIRKFQDCDFELKKFIWERLAPETKIKLEAPELLCEDIAVLKRLLAADFNNLLDGEWQITDNTISRLQDEKTTQDVIALLMPLKDKKYHNETELISQLSGCRDNKALLPYKHLILKYSYNSIYYMNHGNIPLARIVEYPVLRRFINRQTLDTLFCEALRPGNRIEFYDKLYSCADVVRLFPVAFADTLDLSVCNSILLGEAVKQRCENAEVIINQWEASLDYRLIFYKHLIRWLANHDDTYINANIKLRNALLKKI